MTMHSLNLWALMVNLFSFENIWVIYCIKKHKYNYNHDIDPK